MMSFSLTHWLIIRTLASKARPFSPIVLVDMLPFVSKRVQKRAEEFEIGIDRN